MSHIGENHRRLLERIEQAALRSGRDPAAVRLVGVTKKVDVERIREAVDGGLADLGENRIQEAEDKIPRLERAGVRYHLIGHLQTNKAGKAVKLFSWVQSVDSESLARRLDRMATGGLRILIQVKSGDEQSKSGVAASDLAELVNVVRSLKNLELQGFMTIPPFFEDVEDVRPYFRNLRRKAEEFSLPELSMGMSHDFEVAVEEGATIVRVGTALFGTRS